MSKSRNRAYLTGLFVRFQCLPRQSIRVEVRKHGSHYALSSKYDPRTIWKKPTSKSIDILQFGIYLICSTHAGLRACTARAFRVRVRKAAAFEAILSLSKHQKKSCDTCWLIHECSRCRTPSPVAATRRLPPDIPSQLCSSRVRKVHYRFAPTYRSIQPRYAWSPQLRSPRRRLSSA